MSNDASTDANVSTEGPETAAETAETPFEQSVREFKLSFASELHRLADAGNLCTVFDSVMNEIGLPARERYTTEGSRDSYGYSEYNYRGADVMTVEDNEDDAERWKMTTARRLHEATESYGHREVYDATNGRYVRLSEALEYLGFPTKTDIPVKLTGTFEITFNVNGWEDANLIDNVSVYTVSDHVSGAINRGDKSVQWKLQRADAEAS